LHSERFISGCPLGQSSTRVSEISPGPRLPRVTPFTVETVTRQEQDKRFYSSAEQKTPETGKTDGLQGFNHVTKEDSFT
ncbi:hypothetical protein CLOM_g17751, partial [Closterium sp. NIES-68]